MEHDGSIAKAQGVVGTGENLLGTHPVALEFTVIGAQAAISALANAVVGEFDQSAQMDFVTHIRLSCLIRQPPEPGEARGVGFLQPADDFLVLEAVLALAAAIEPEVVLGPEAALALEAHDLAACAARTVSRAAGNGSNARSKMPRE